jgi:hypothetical protein
MAVNQYAVQYWLLVAGQRDAKIRLPDGRQWSPVVVRTLAEVTRRRQKSSEVFSRYLEEHQWSSEERHWLPQVVSEKA